jgi:exonuclease VII small subunit
VSIEFHPEALAEFQDAAQYYAGCQENLEQRFIAAVETVLDRI